MSCACISCSSDSQECFFTSMELLSCSSSITFQLYKKDLLWSVDADILFYVPLIVSLILIVSKTYFTDFISINLKHHHVWTLYLFLPISCSELQLDLFWSVVLGIKCRAFYVLGHSLPLAFTYSLPLTYILSSRCF